jgi:hypothetical protein
MVIGLIFGLIAVFLFWVLMGIKTTQKVDFFDNFFHNKEEVKHISTVGYLKTLPQFITVFKEIQKTGSKSSTGCLYTTELKGTDEHIIWFFKTNEDAENAFTLLRVELEKLEGEKSPIIDPSDKKLILIIKFKEISLISTAPVAQPAAK